MKRRISQFLKGASAVFGLALIATTAHASGVGDIVSGVDVSGAKEAIIAIGVTLGALIGGGIAVRYVLGVMKRL